MLMTTMMDEAAAPVGDGIEDGFGDGRGALPRVATQPSAAMVPFEPAAGASSAVMTQAETKRRDYLVSVLNKSTSPQRFLLYHDAPTFDRSFQPERIVTCVYASSLFVAAGTGMATFYLARMDLDNDPRDYTFVVTGLAQATMKAGLKLYASDSRRLRVSSATSSRGAHCTLSMPHGYEPFFVKGNENRDQPQLEEGFINIETDTSFETSNPGVPFVGFGRPDPYDSDQILPLVVWAPSPGAAYSAKLSNSWFCARGAVGKREITEPSNWTHAASFELIAPGMQKKLVFTPNGQFSDT